MDKKLIYEELNNGSKTFKEIFDALIEKKAISFDDIGDLYSDMTLDPNLVQVGNVWDLKNRHKLEEFFVHIEEEIEEEEEEMEEKLTEEIASPDSDLEFF